MQACKPLGQAAPAAASAQPLILYEKQNFFEPVCFDEVEHIPMSFAGSLAVDFPPPPLPPLLSVFGLLKAFAIASAAALSLAAFARSFLRCAFGVLLS